MSSLENCAKHPGFEKYQVADFVGRYFIDDIKWQTLQYQWHLAAVNERQR